MNARPIAILLAALMLSLPVTSAAELKLQYDANGNLVSGDGKYRVYNSLNQLSAIYNGSDANGTKLETYTYHPSEERILTKTRYWPNGSVQDTTYYLSKTFAQVINDTGAVANYTYVYHDGQLVAQSLNGVKLYMANDHKGSVLSTMNASGAVIQDNQYTPYGSIAAGGTATRYNYEGKEADPLVGDTDFNFRKYRADWGMFTQPDNVIENVYDPQQLNRYTFEHNNALKYTDPTGHFGIFAYGAALAFIFAPRVIKTGYLLEYIALREYNTHHANDPKINQMLTDRIGNEAESTFAEWAPGSLWGSWRDVWTDGRQLRDTTDTVMQANQKTQTDLASKTPTGSPADGGVHLTAGFVPGVGYITSDGHLFPTNNPHWHPTPPTDNGLRPSSAPLSGPTGGDSASPADKYCSSFCLKSPCPC